MTPAAPAVLLLLLTTALPARPPEVRQEARLDFAVDAALQDRGGMQYFFALAKKDQRPFERPEFRSLRPLLPDPALASTPLHALASRVVYTLERDVGFFTPERAVSPAFMNAILPEGEIRRRPDGTFRTRLQPANSFSIRVLGEEQLHRMEAQGDPGSDGAPAPTGAPASAPVGAPAPARDPGQAADVSAFLALTPELGRPHSVVIQHNYDFARVMGVRTGAASVTWTAHYRLAPGRTRVVSTTLSLLHNVPPFFLGGDERVHQEARDGALMLIERMRRYREVPPQ